MAYNFQTWFRLTIHTIQFVSQLHSFTSFNQQSAIHPPPSQPLLWLLHHFSVLPGTRSNVSTSHPRRRKSRAAPAAPAIFSYQHDVCLASAGTETHLPPASGDLPPSWISGSSRHCWELLFKVVMGPWFGFFPLLVIPNLSLRLTQVVFWPQVLFCDFFWGEKLAALFSPTQKLHKSESLWLSELQMDRRRLQPA